MTRNKSWTAVSKALAAVTVLLIVTLALASGAAASSYEILHSFTWAKAPSGDLIFDKAGNLYGTTRAGASPGCVSLGSGSGCGAVYKLAPGAKGTWRVSILHVFTGEDGSAPFAGLIFDAAGNLYGTTYGGGAGGGVVFKLAPNLDGTWRQSVLHSFTGTDGYGAFAGLIFDAAGNLYGTTEGGGADGYGVVYKLAPNPDGTWTESVLHSFTGTDGWFPYAALIFDSAGNLYGTTYYGGGTACEFGCGVVYKLSPNPDGTWTESVLRSLIASDGTFPYGRLIFDASGNLYGTTQYGGAAGYGVVFKFAPNLDGTWTETVLHSFMGTDGYGPLAGLVFDTIGNLYGTAAGGGAAGDGMVFKLTPHPDGKWTECELHIFTGTGKYPLAGLTMDAAGDLYGTTSAGTDNYGLVFEITP